MLRILLTLALLTLLGACANNDRPDAQDPLGQSSAVSVSMPEFVTAPGTTLRWRSDLIWVDDPEGRYERRADMLQAAIAREFELKGYRFVTAGTEATYDVLAVAVLGDLAGHEEVSEIFRLYPSLAASPSGYAKGNVLLAIAPSGTRNIVWRGALEVFTDSGMQTLEQRQQRMNWGARQLLDSIPSYR